MDRFYYFDEELVETKVLKGIYKAVLDLALKNEPKLISIVVNNINFNQCIENIFGKGTVNSNKLNRRESIKQNGVIIQLKSPKGFNSLSDLGHVIAIHPSDDTLNSVESNDNMKSLFVVAEISASSNTHYLLDWAETKEAQNVQAQ